MIAARATVVAATPITPRPTVTPVAARFADPKKTPENLLLWFHHVSWDHRMASGRTLWDELVHRYDRGVAAVGQMRRDWDAQRGRVAAQRFEQVAAFLAIQEREAQWWRDACVAYFQSISRRPLPAGARPPAPVDRQDGDRQVQAANQRRRQRRPLSIARPLAPR